MPYGCMSSAVAICHILKARIILNQATILNRLTIPNQVIILNQATILNRLTIPNQVIPPPPPQLQLRPQFVGTKIMSARYITKHVRG